MKMSGTWKFATTLMLGLLCSFFINPASAQLPTTSSAASQLTVVTGLGNATGVGVDQFGNLYYTDAASGQVNELPGANGVNPNLLSVSVAGGSQVTVDTIGNVYVAAGAAGVVYEYTYTNYALNLNTPVSLGKNLGTVTGVAVDLSGNVYAVDNTNKQVVKISAGTQTVVLSKLISPQQIAVDKSGGLYVADAGANAIIYLPSGATTSQTLGTGLNAPKGVAVDTTGNVYIADTGNAAIKEIVFSAGLTSTPVTLASSITTPTSIAVDSWGSLYVAGGATVYHLSYGQGIYLGLVQVNTKSAVVPVNITFTSALTPATIKVVTTGLTGLDWADAGDDTCKAGASYAVNSTCSMNVTFTPQFAGPRFGAIVFYDSNNKVLTRIFLGGSGLGPLLTYDTLPANSNTASVQNGNPASAVYPNNSATNPYPVAINQPHGGRFDAAGNLFLADYGSDRVIELPANATAPVIVATGVGLQDVALNGAGDLVMPNTSAAGTVVLIPYENGTWNPADSVNLASGYSKPRTIAVDVLGNSYTCDTGNKKSYRISPAGVTTLLLPSITPTCTGVAVDGWGNFAETDGTTKQIYYAPATGAAAYLVTTGLSSPWGLAFDASGSLYASDDGATTNLRVPNENGTLVTAHQEKIDGNKSYSLALDNFGNIATFPLVGTTVPAYYNYNMISRSSPSPFFAGVSLAVTTAISPYVVVNNGNQAPAFTNGLVTLGDVDDFSESSTYTGSWTTLFTAGSAYAPGLCNFSTTIEPSTVCYVGVNSVSTGITGPRVEYLQLPTQAPTTPQARVTAGSGTAPTTGATLTLAVSPTAPSVGQAITVTVNAGSGPTGPVTLEIDGTLMQAQELSSGAATFTLSSGLSVGAHTIGVIYAGDKTYTPINTPVTTSVTVKGATPTLTIAASAKDITVGQTVTLTADVATTSGATTPTGSVTFLDGGNSLGTGTLAGGTASLAVSTLKAGTHTVTFTYTGDSVYAAGTSASTTVTVGTYVATTTALVLSPTQPAGGYAYGTKITATATVSATSGTPTGSIAFNLDGIVQVVALTGTSANVTLTPGAGIHTLTASYTGDSTYDSSSATATFTTLQAATIATLSVSSTSYAAGSNVTLKAVVTSISSQPTGTVTFRNGLAVLGTVTLDSTGTAVLITYKLPCGADLVTSSYAGDSNDLPSSTSGITVTPICNATTTTASSSPIIVTNTAAPSAILTGTIISSAPSTVVAPVGGSVIFTDQSGNLIGTGGVSGTASSASGSYTWNNPVPGTIYTVSAKYSGDNYFLPSIGTTRVCIAPASGPYPGDYSVSMSPTPLNVTIGTPASATISISSTNSYCGYVQLTCSNLPAYTACIMSPTQVTVDGTTKVQTVTLTVDSQVAYQVAAAKPKGTLVQFCALLGAPLLCLCLLGGFARGRKLMRSVAIRNLLGVLLLALVGALVTACGDHPPQQTPAGTYTVNIVTTGTGGINHVTPIQMVFK